MNNKRNLRSILISALLLILAAVFGVQLWSDPQQNLPNHSTIASGQTTAYRFRNTKLLDEHYKKHGVEMGFSSAEEYEIAASAVVNSSAALQKTEKEDGDFVYYLEKTNEFVIVSTDGYIRTYFYPNDGKAYFDRQ